jgi:hypothetical protein
MMETECNFVHQHFSVVVEFRITFTGILATELIQNIKPNEGEELSDVSPWNAVVRLEMDVNVSCIALYSGCRYKGHNA